MKNVVLTGLLLVLAHGVIACNDDGTTDYGSDSATDTYTDTDTDMDTEECDGCLVGDECWTDGAINPGNVCEKCDATLSAVAWSYNDGQICDDEAFCTIDDVCSSGVCGGAAWDCTDEVACNGAESCDEENDTCVAGTSTCVAPEICDTLNDACVATCVGCIIDGTCYPDGVANPTNPCEKCDMAASPQAWSNNDGALCDDGEFCNGADTCGGGTCSVNPGDPCSSGDSCNNTCNEQTKTCFTANDTTCTLTGPDPLRYFDPTCDGKGECEGTYYCDDHHCWLTVPTGQEKCYDNTSTVMTTCPPFPCDAEGSPEFCGQDAQYPSNLRTFTCYLNGSPLETCDLSADEHETVLDSLTGLEWQRTWETGKNWVDATAYCGTLNDDSYGGYNTGWRLPSYHELTSIQAIGIPVISPNPLIDTDAFPGTPDSYFWSSSSYVGIEDNAWVVSFGAGYVMRTAEAGNHGVRCVRSGPSSSAQAQERFVVSGETDKEIVFDRSTGLYWTKKYESLKNWQAALDHCENPVYGGKPDWRLPTLTELRGLVDVTKNNPASSFPDMPDSYFWSSSSVVSYALNAWLVDFGNRWGGVVASNTKTLDFSVRCVRSGP